MGFSRIASIIIFTLATCATANPIASVTAEDVGPQSICPKQVDTHSDGGPSIDPEWLELEEAVITQANASFVKYWCRGKLPGTNSALFKPHIELLLCQQTVYLKLAQCEGACGKDRSGLKGLTYKARMPQKRDQKGNMTDAKKVECLKQCERDEIREQKEICATS